jgi:hypothetical protein
MRMQGSVFVSPHILVMGRDRKGREYDLLGFGHWIAEENISIGPDGFLPDGMSRALVRSYWQWANRPPPMPKHLDVYIRINPAFRDWVLLSQAFDFVASKISFDPDEIKTMLVTAFRNGHVRTRGVRLPPERQGDKIIERVEQIEVQTSDLIKWLEYEHNIKARLVDLLTFNDPSGAPIYEVLLDWEGKK